MALGEGVVDEAGADDGRAGRPASRQLRLGAVGEEWLGEEDDGEEGAVVEEEDEDD